MKTAGKRALSCNFNILLQLIKEGQWVHRAGGEAPHEEEENRRLMTGTRKTKEERREGREGYLAQTLASSPNSRLPQAPPEPLSHDHHKGSLRM